MKSDSTHRGSLRHRAAWLLAAATLLASCQPERPTTGPGSTQNYIATSAAITNAGEATPTDNTKVAYYVPNVLKHGTTAPVVVFLHGFQAGDPGLYIAHINHLWHQGYIVIFPMFNTTNGRRGVRLGVPVQQRHHSGRPGARAPGARHRSGARSGHRPRELPGRGPVHHRACRDPHR